MDGQHRTTGLLISADGPPVEPYAHGLLDVGDANLVYWETCGNPAGKPVLMVHGGPGSGAPPRLRRAVDLDRCRLILFDQRGCGRSRPHASDPGTDLSVNTTDHLVADMERLREHLGVQRWLLTGGSWGSTLILAYAQRHPERVSEVVIAAVTTSRRHEIDWLYRGVGRFLPAEWERFRDGSGPTTDGDLVGAYARLLEDRDPRVRERAAEQWCAWEDAVVGMEQHGSPTPFGGRPGPDRLALVRICAHYFAHAAWLPEGALIQGAPRLAGIPAVLVHGRLDLGSPLRTAWELARAWPGSELVIVDDAGHLGSPTMRDRTRNALDAFTSAGPG